jgi:hypothetical protein
VRQVIHPALQTDLAHLQYLALPGHHLAFADHVDRQLVLAQRGLGEQPEAGVEEAVLLQCHGVGSLQVVALALVEAQKRLAPVLHAGLRGDLMADERRNEELAIFPA